MISLRTYAFIDNLQPQLASFIGTASKGFLPLPGQASLHVEVAPGMAVNQAMDIVLKATKVTPGLLIIERSFGLLEVHHDDQGEVRQAGDSLLKHYGLGEEDRMEAKVISDEIIRAIEPYHAQLLNKIRYGSMILPGESLFILETEPAGYIVLAANEAEKAAAAVKLIEVRSFGAYGRLYMSGEEAMIDSARQAALGCLKGIKGKA